MKLHKTMPCSLCYSKTFHGSLITRQTQSKCLPWSLFWPFCLTFQYCFGVRGLRATKLINFLYVEQTLPFPTFPCAISSVSSVPSSRLNFPRPYPCFTSRLWTRLCKVLWPDTDKAACEQHRIWLGRKHELYTIKWERFSDDLRQQWR